jgi:hypothetical protein
MERILAWIRRIWRRRRIVQFHSEWIPASRPLVDVRVDRDRERELRELEEARQRVQRIDREFSVVHREKP